jgi:hypothetical protein
MANPTPDLKAYWRALILDLQLPEEDTQNLLAVAEQVNPAHGVRAAMANFSDIIAQLNLAALPAFDAYTQTLPKVPPFSFMPIIEYAARFMKAARLISPASPLLVATNDLASHNAKLLAHTPMTQAVIRAAEGDPRVFFRNFVRDSQLVVNFGYRDLDIDSPQHLRILYQDSYPLFSAYYLVGAARGTCQYFHAHADASFEAIDDHDFYIHIRW